MLEFLKEFYTYILRITEISSDSQSIVLQGSISLDPPDRDFTWVSGKSYGMLVGCSYELFDMIPQVSSLARRKRHKIKESRKQKSQSQKNNASNELDADEMAYRILKSRILSWQPPPDARKDFVTCGWIYQQAILCHLDASFANPPITAQAPLPEFIIERFENLKLLLGELPVDAPISHTLCWPLALFGSLARGAEHRELIFNRLQAMWELLRLGNVKTTMNFLRRLWDDNSGDFVYSSSNDTSATGDSSTVIRAPKRKRISKVVYDNSDMEALMKRYELMFSFA